MGVSRSATIVIAFLMIKRNFSATEAVELVRFVKKLFIHLNGQEVFIVEINL